MHLFIPRSLTRGHTAALGTSLLYHTVTNTTLQWHIAAVSPNNNTRGHTATAAHSNNSTATGSPSRISALCRNAIR